jgi:hypothetical protein
LNRPLGLPEDTVLYFLKTRTLEKLKRIRDTSFSSKKEWDYIIWRKESKKEVVEFT